MYNLTNINNLRMNLSSFSKIYELKNYIKLDSKFNFNENLRLNNKKIININNFEFKINNKKIKYSTIYTNPFSIYPKIAKKIKLDKNKNKVLDDLCKKIFLSNYEILDNYDSKELYKLVIKKKNIFMNKFIGIEQSLLILWYIIYLDKYIDYFHKKIYFHLIKTSYISFISEKFNFNDIIIELVNSKNLLNKKFYLSLYILTEEFHYKYINTYLEINEKLDIIFNSSYTKINPQSILNDIDNQLKYSIHQINEDISCPFGHNVLFIKSNKNKIFYYDPDEQTYSDLYKLKILFKESSIDFFNISNRKPIQTITDDYNCVFYCIGFIKYIIQNNVKLELNKLKLSSNLYESYILYTDIDIFRWTINL
jgi:hypothetical protein